MIAAAGGLYRMNVTCPPEVRRWAVGVVSAAIAFLAATTVAAAATTIDVGDQPVVQVWARGASEVTVHTWDRESVQIDSDDDQAQLTRRNVDFGTPQNPLSVTIPVTMIRVREPDGTPGTATLPPEDFPYAATMRPGNHDVVRFFARAGSHTVVTVPANTAILDARVLGAGTLAIDNFHGGTLFALGGGGRTTIANVQAAAFIQQLNGHLVVLDSTFERLRARGNTAGMLFERCRAKQIEVTTYSGPIVYDNGTFDQGLARFQSTDGPVAIGVGFGAGAQIAARTQTGQVFGMWDRRATFDQRAAGDATAVVGNGGPVVNAASGRGNIFVYDGTLASRREVPPEWRAIRAAFRNGGPAAPPFGFFRPTGSDY